MLEQACEPLLLVFQAVEQAIFEQTATVQVLLEVAKSPTEMQLLSQTLNPETNLTMVWLQGGSAIRDDGITWFEYGGYIIGA